MPDLSTQHLRDYLERRYSTTVHITRVLPLSRDPSADGPTGRRYDRRRFNVVFDTSHEHRSVVIEMVAPSAR